MTNFVTFEFIFTRTLDSIALKKEIFSISNPEQFNEISLKIFHFQYKQCQIYKDYIDRTGIPINNITNADEIPFLPIRFFKSHEVYSGDIAPSTIFLSSTTTGQTPSKHLICDEHLYQESFLRAFEFFHGKPEQYIFVALLPSYIERGNSSLVYMMDHLIGKSNHAFSGFYKTLDASQIDVLIELDKSGQKIFLIGVTYALLDLLEKRNFSFKNTHVLETGGMKGRRKEMIKSELYEILKQGFNVADIHSEYGMTELLSQAYSKKDGLFFTPPWMRVLTREINDPFKIIKNKTGAINVIDLANIYSCSFIATEDIGRVHTHDSFEILGRMHESEMRGCNLMMDI